MQACGAKCRFRVVAPVYPAFNIYSGIARHTTALGPVLVATVVNRMADWEAEVIDEVFRLRQGGILQR